MSSTENITPAEVTEPFLCAFGWSEKLPSDYTLHTPAREQVTVLVQQEPSNVYECKSSARSQVLGRHCCKAETPAICFTMINVGQAPTSVSLGENYLVLSISFLKVKCKSYGAFLWEKAPPVVKRLKLHERRLI